MTTRTVTAMFNSRAEAERAAEQLVSQLGLDRAVVRLNPETGATDTGYSQSRPYEETGFFASIKSLFVPDEDRYAYAEGMRRGGVLVSARVDERQRDQAVNILEHGGAVDLDQQEASWRQGGWTGYDASAHAKVAPSTTTAGTAARAGTMAAGTAPGTATRGDEVIPVVEERLVVGKREVERGHVRVRSYVVERPVEEQVRLHEERVGVERRPVDRPLTDADRTAAFQERTIETTARAEEAVVSKEARVVEEIAVHKDATDRTETVRDTVRRTEVEVEDGATTGRGTGAAATTGATGVGAAVDRTLGTNISGTNSSRK